MNPLVVICIIAGATFVLINIFKVKAALVYLSLAAGLVTSTYVTSGALDCLRYFNRNYNQTVQVIFQLCMLLVPVILTLVFLRKTVNGAKWLTNLPAAILTSAFAVYLVVPLLTPGTSGSVMSSSTWEQLVNYQTMIIGAGVFLSLLQLWSGGHAARSKKSKRKHK